MLRSQNSALPRRSTWHSPGRGARSWCWSAEIRRVRDQRLVCRAVCRSLRCQGLQVHRRAEGLGRVCVEPARHPCGPWWLFPDSAWSSRKTRRAWLRFSRISIARCADLVRSVAPRLSRALLVTAVHRGMGECTPGTKVPGTRTCGRAARHSGGQPDAVAGSRRGGVPPSDDENLTVRRPWWSRHVRTSTPWSHNVPSAPDRP